MPRVRIAPGVRCGELVTLRKPEAHYVARVLRLRAGEEISAFDGEGKTCRLRLITVSPTLVEGVVIAPLAHSEARCTPVVLGQALTKGAKMDLVVEKCSELGLTTLVPLYTARTVVREQATHAAAKLVRWRRIAEAAARQCGRATLLEVQTPMSLADFCTTYRAAPLKLVCWEEERQRGLRQALVEAGQGSPIVVLVGPEGGLTPAEVAMAQQQGFIPVGLGPRILRTETAAIVVIGVIRYSLGELEPQKE